MKLHWRWIWSNICTREELMLPPRYLCCQRAFCCYGIQFPVLHAHVPNTPGSTGVHFPLVPGMWGSRETVKTNSPIFTISVSMEMLADGEGWNPPLPISAVAGSWDQLVLLNSKHLWICSVFILEKINIWTQIKCYFFFLKISFWNIIPLTT